MNWLYIIFGILGALAPTGIIYAINYDRRIPGLFIDLGLLFFSAGLSILFIPVGLGAGLGLAYVVALAWRRGPGRARSAGSGLAGRPSPSGERPGSRESQE